MIEPLNKEYGHEKEGVRRYFVVEYGIAHSSICALYLPAATE